MKKVDITMQKAMKIRKSMKEWLSNSALNFLDCGLVKFVNTDDPSVRGKTYPILKEEILNQKIGRLEKMTATEYFDKITSTMKQLEELNQAIEKSNQRQHLLLIEENYHQSMIAFLDKARKHLIIDRTITPRIRTERIAEFEFNKIEYEEWQIPLTEVDIDSLLKSEKTALNKCRDEISYLDASIKITVDLDEEWL